MCLDDLHLRYHLEAFKKRSHYRCRLLPHPWISQVNFASCIAPTTCLVAAIDAKSLCETQREGEDKAPRGCTESIICTIKNPHM
jgi:hypothetical protein